MRYKECGFPSCHTLLPQYGPSRCALHTSVAESRYKTIRWVKETGAFLIQYPKCTTCGQKSQVVDHIVRARAVGVNFWDHSNWQALCKTCHAQKTLRGA